MRQLMYLFVALFCASPVLATPKEKTEVRVEIVESVAKEGVADNLSKDSRTSSDNVLRDQVFYMNVTVAKVSTDPDVKTGFLGQWCITSDTELQIGSAYHGTLSGNSSIELEIPQKNGKIKKKSFDVFDHKWRKLPDL